MKFIHNHNYTLKKMKNQFLKPQEQGENAVLKFIHHACGRAT
jgi:hypothetical protein